jgi:hypothetical protein
MGIGILLGACPLGVLCREVHKIRFSVSKLFVPFTSNKVWQKVNGQK